MAAWSARVVVIMTHWYSMPAKTPRWQRHWSRVSAQAGQSSHSSGSYGAVSGPGSSGAVRRMTGA
ncbi:hypothetical protein AQJ84_09205 [Streptomyces resistomycificus]|uniref:Uncharacterized protein n=1 Tax=Streptomyces resistomycificus TaxID=67356 RepID=A0A0L8M062_9ACTN|nr:hypothetical protein ADK37_00840 [Streptomyces resistomycificus]KUO00279.1 hypothetical protein AQJ84_09205 [Streptomyces resistomycificus]